MDFPYALDVAGNDLWVANVDGNSFQGWTLQGSPVLNITSYGAPTTLVSFPHAIAIGPDGYLYLADSGNGQIAFFTQAGIFEGTFGHGQLPLIYGLAVSSTKVYACSSVDPGAIVEFPITGSDYLKSFGTPVTVTPTGQASLTAAKQMALDGSGNLYVADPGDYRIVKFSPALTFISAVTLVSGTGDAVALDPAGNIFTDANGVQVYSPSGALLTQFAQGLLLDEDGIAVDAADNVYLPDPGSNDVMVFQKN